MLTRLAALVAPPLCWGCSGAAPRGSPLCRPCARGLRRLPPGLADLAGVPCFSAVAYEGAARDLVRALKFHAALGVAGSMAAAIVATAPEGLLLGAVLVPVPLSPARERRRGFNQALVLARAVRERTGCAVVDCLERSGGSGTQVGRDRAERALALAGSVHASGAAGRLARVLLVDDVATTGATLAAGAEALRGAGCEHVQAVTYARTLGRL